MVGQKESQMPKKNKDPLKYVFLKVVPPEEKRHGKSGKDQPLSLFAVITSLFWWLP
jgi:hypothetical protein